MKTIYLVVTEIQDDPTIIHVATESRELADAFLIEAKKARIAWGYSFITKLSMDSFRIHGWD